MNKKWVSGVIFIIVVLTIVFGTLHLKNKDNKDKIVDPILSENKENINQEVDNAKEIKQGKPETFQVSLLKGSKDDVESVQRALLKIQNGEFNTKGNSLNISSYFLPAPDPNKKITSMSSANYEGYFIGSDYSFLLNTDNGDNKSSMKIVNKDSIKYMTIVSSSILDKDLKESDSPEAQNLYNALLNKPFIIPEKLLGPGGFAIGSLLEGWGFSKNLMHTPNLLNPDEWFLKLKTPIFSVLKLDQKIVNNSAINRYQLNIIKSNIIPFAVEFQTNSWGKVPTSVEEGLIKDDFGRIKDAEIILDTNSKTGDPISINMYLSSLDLQDKIYRNLEYIFKANQTFEKIDKAKAVTKPDTDLIMPPIFFGTVVN